MKDYEYIVFDAQYILVRNFSALMSRTKIPEIRYLKPTEGNASIGHVIDNWDFTVNSLVKQFFWSIVKVIRDNYSCNKVILLWDSAPYHRSSILSDFKGDRIHHSAELLEEWDIENDPQGYLQEQARIEVEKKKLAAKFWIINNLQDFGMYSVIQPGYEADDLAYMFTHLDIFQDKCNLKSAICSADSDWMYWISNNFDFINFNKMEPWTVDDVIGECSGYPTELGMDLFETKCYSDSLFLSHNGLQRTTNRTWSSFKDIVTHIKNGDYSDLTDVERFKLNMKSFEIWNFPGYDEALSELRAALNKGKLNGVSYDTLSSRGFEVSRSYCETYQSLLNPDYYERS